MSTVNKIIDLIEAGKNYFLLKNPSSSEIQIMILASESVEFTIPTNDDVYVSICAFNDNKPQLVKVELRLKLPQEKFHDVFKNVVVELPHLKNQTSTKKEAYIKSVETGLDDISSGKLDKIVLAQTNWMKHNLSKPFAIYSAVCSVPNSYAYQLRFNDNAWMGASPELFLKTDYSSCETVALAGTRVDQKSDSEWGEKEKHEQSIVGSFLVNEFSKLGFDNIAVEPTFTKKIADIEHICNPVTANVPPGTNWLDVLQVLHPTPALAGYPKTEAIQLIDKLEAFSRSLYGGYLGVITNKSFELFVNIRCARIGSNGVQLFAGAGINKDSIPSKEWDETQNKLSVMSQYFDSL